MDIKRSYRFRCYPTPAQEQLLTRTFGCARFVYNHMLQLRTDAWNQRREQIGYHASSAALTTLKKQPEYAWLNEVSSVPVQQALRHLQAAFARFFAKQARYPQFRRRNDTQSAEFTRSSFKWDGGTLSLAKMREPLKIRWSRHIPRAAKVTTVTVSKDAAGRYFVSMMCDDVAQPKPVALGEVGIDLGLTHFAVLSNGEKVDAPRSFRNNEAKLAKLQRRAAKKTRGSKRHKKAKKKVARLHAKIADARNDFLHKLSSRLINENQVIAVESLAVANMLKNRPVAKSISDAGWSEFLRQLEYKARWYGRTLINVGRWVPSTKTCSECGHKVPRLALSVRAWSCPSCAIFLDRDVNAARNILAAGRAVSAHGETVSPART